LGRPAKTINERQLQGTVPQGKSHVESYLSPSRPRFPKDVPPAARKVYKELWSVLEDRRALTRGDFQLLRLFAFLWYRHQQMGRAGQENFVAARPSLFTLVGIRESVDRALIFADSTGAGTDRHSQNSRRLLLLR
jgi:hypothetical protein